MPAPRRTRKGFQPAGSIPADRLGIPAKRAREMRLELAWRRVAGETLARAAPLLGVRRGVLEVETTDRRWAETLLDLLPELGGRMAAACPELRIRACRLHESGQADRVSPRLPLLAPGPELAPSATRRAVERASAREGASTEVPASPEERRARFVAAMERYLERTRERSG